VELRTTRLLRVNYLLEDTALFGGVKIQLHHANLLHRRGHQIRVISRGPRPSWYMLDTPFDSVPEFSADTVPETDLNVATYWTTIAPAARLPTGVAVHYCQGFEASYTHNQHEHGAILEAYALPLPAFALAPHLADIVRQRFNRPARVVPPALEAVWRPRFRRRPNRPARVLVVGPYEIDWKGVATALEAVKMLRNGGVDLRLVRVSQWPLTDHERELVAPDEFHCHLAPGEVARIVSGCDILLAPSWEQEGFGMPVLEAMACGLPVVASQISSFRGYAEGAAEFVPPQDAVAFASVAREVLNDRRRWRRMRRAGLAVAREFTEQKTLRELESAVHWAIAGEWRQGT
jgi:glycosyltransferase involved in cell wall biosynthesis